MATPRVITALRACGLLVRLAGVEQGKHHPARSLSCNAARDWGGNCRGDAGLGVPRGRFRRRNGRHANVGRFSSAAHPALSARHSLAGILLTEHSFTTTYRTTTTTYYGNYCWQQVWTPSGWHWVD